MIPLPDFAPGYLNQNLHLRHSQPPAQCLNHSYNHSIEDELWNGLSYFLGGFQTEDGWSHVTDVLTVNFLHLHQ